jgi:transcriptional regulator with XRE-family HTH domain
MATHNKAEREAFAQRLKAALTRGRKRISTPTALAEAFNLRWHGRSVTPQAAQKWLSGLAMPEPDKIEVLAQMTGVPVTWLRYGLPERRETTAPSATEARGGRYEQVDKSSVTAEELRLLAQLRLMPPPRRELVRQLVQELALESEMWTK